jgi:hypothetical protein
VGFAHLIIAPDANRSPCFDGIEGDPNAIVEFPCIACSKTVRIPLWRFLDANLSWQHNLPSRHVSQLAGLFRLKSETIMGYSMYVGHGSRFPVIGSCACDMCGHELTICISYDELSPLHYEAVLDGVAEWAPD